jgi:competence protein ComEA
LELFEKIKDSMIYEKKETNNQYIQNDSVSFSPKIDIHELNSSNQQELIELPGIGNYTAKSIINFREALGGFFSISQLLEVYNMRIENYDKMKNHLSLDTSLIKKININNISYEELSKHPYLSNNQANSIVKMRMQKGGYFRNKEEILESVLIDEETFNKLQYYLCVE